MKRLSARLYYWAFSSLVFLGIVVALSPLALSARELTFPIGLPWLIDQRIDEVQPSPGHKLLGPSASLSDLFAPEPQEFELFGLGEKLAIEQQLPLSLPFRGAIEAVASRYQLDSRLLAAVVEAESNFNPRAVSPRGAVGLTQVLPATGGLDDSELHDPEINLDAGARYLRELLDQYDGQTQLALAAYNAGPGRVNRYGGVPPFGETRRYIRKVMELYEQHRQGGWRGEEPVAAPAGLVLGGRAAQ